MKPKKGGERKLKKKIIIGVIVFIVVVGIIGAASGGDNNTSTTNNTATEATNNNQSQPAEEQTATTVVATDFIAEFDKNQLAAEEKYKGKLIEFTAKIKNISEDITGTPFLSLEPETAEEYYFGTTIQCFFKEKSELTSLENGQVVTLRGTADTQSLGIIGVKSCQVVQ